ncbi:MAG: hypothetical protein D6744_03780 [Planctomycetota bacterium]|nr:MAG: hypothetical protein D6744_03780 [Planctomycetota bacterium]
MQYVPEQGVEPFDGGDRRSRGVCDGRPQADSGTHKQCAPAIAAGDVQENSDEKCHGAGDGGGAERGGARAAG